MSLKDMKKIFYILLFVAAGCIYAQDSTNVATQGDFTAPSINILTKIEFGSELACPPIISNKQIFVTGKNGLVSCYDTTGHMLWQNDLRVEITTRPAIAGGNFIAGDSNGDIFVLDSKTGNQIQSIGIDRKISSDIICFEYTGDIEIAIPKTSESKDAIVFATDDGKVHCYDLETLQEYWTNHDAQDTVNGTPVCIDNKIFYNSADGYLYCINAKNGLLIWRWKETAESSFYNSNIVTDRKTVFVVSNNKDIIGIDLLLGKLTWKSSNVKVMPSLVLSRDRKTLLAQTDDNKILLFSADQGKVTKTIKLDESLDENPISILERENKMFFARGNRLFLVEQRNSEELLLEIGNSRINFITQLDEGKFFTSYMNGTLLIFNMR
jgi:eukaryotic-like serine/threonine-protein kinase